MIESPIITPAYMMTVVTTQGWPRFAAQMPAAMGTMSSGIGMPRPQPTSTRNNPQIAQGEPLK